MGQERLLIRVLLVDDETEFTDVLAQRLEARGLELETAASGPEALKKADEKRFDVVVLDMRMPGMDGLETLRRLHEKNADLQVVFLTGRATLKEGIEAMKGGAFELLEKPVDMGELLDILKRAQEKKQRLDEERMDKDIRDILDSKGW